MKKYIVLLVSVAALTAVAQPKPKAENVILVTLDGMRWQEIFRGADSSFFKQQKHIEDSRLKEKYWRDDLNERRKALMPFLWTTVATKGTLIGNRDQNSLMNVTNQMWFSYPGYNELLSGKADDEHVASNDSFYNPNTTVLEVINSRSSFQGRVAAFTSWDCFPFIINDKRSGVMVSAGLTPSKSLKLTEAEKVMNKIMPVLPTYSGTTRPDALTFYFGLEYIRKFKPRVVFFSFDETDHFAHGGEYGAYLNSAHSTDAMLSELWAYLQSDSQYRGKTTMIVTVDHGRGNDAENWKHHGRKIDNADQIWMVAVGAGVDAGGEEKNSPQAYQSQLAATIASLLGVPFETGAGKLIALGK